MSDPTTAGSSDETTPADTVPSEGRVEDAPTTSPTDSSPITESADSDEMSAAKKALAERTADLQRLQAEYVNYKRRVDRDRDVSRTAGVEGVLKDLLPVLDDLRSARQHEELSAGFKAVADEIERVTGKYGLISYGEKGDADRKSVV